MTPAPVIRERLTAKHRRRPPLLIGLAMLAIVTAGYFGWQHFAQRAHIAPQSLPPVPVITTTVQQQNFPIVLTGIGNVAALNSATVRSMVTEQIISIEFKDGQFVKKGQLLAQLDPSSLQAQLAQAEANLARDQAHLHNAQLNLSRYVPLEKKALHRSSRSPLSRR
jgi:membrane fusion protein, multidrug efflux system